MSLLHGCRASPGWEPGACRLHLWLPPRAPHLGSRRVPPSPRGGAVPRPSSRLSPEGSGCQAARALLGPRPLTLRRPPHRRRGGGVRRRAGKGGRAGAQVCSSTRAGRRRRRTRRCHCRRHLRATTRSPVRPGPPRSTRLSISGAPRRSSSLRRRTVGCSFHTRPRRLSAKPGKLLSRALESHDLSPKLLRAMMTHDTSRLHRQPRSSPPGAEERPRVRFTRQGCNGVQGGTDAASAGSSWPPVPRGFWLRPSTSERNLCPPMCLLF